MQQAPVHPLIMARLVKNRAALVSKLSAQRDAAVVPLERALAGLTALAENQDAVDVADFIEEYAVAIAQLKALDMARLPAPANVAAIGQRLRDRLREITARAGLDTGGTAPLL